MEFQLTDANGDYDFVGQPDGNYTVRVVNATVTSSRAGYVAGLLPVQTFRTDASGAAPPSRSPIASAARVPALTDAGRRRRDGDGHDDGRAHDRASTTAQSITTVTASAGPDVAGVDFGFNFDTIVNVNDCGPGFAAAVPPQQQRAAGNALAQSGSRIDLGRSSRCRPPGRRASS